MTSTMLTPQTRRLITRDSAHRGYYSPEESRPGGSSMILVDDERSLLDVPAFDDDDHHHHHHPQQQQQPEHDHILLPTTTPKNYEHKQDESKDGSAVNGSSASTIFSYLNNISSSPSRITKTVTKGLSGAAAPALNLYNGRRMTGLDSKKNV
jgi:hypothetical protein